MLTKYCNYKYYLKYYFEIVDQICPDSILDIGMLLKRFGLICRQAGGYEISKNIEMIGIDFMPQLLVGSPNNIYDKIIIMDELLHLDKKFDLIFFLEPSLYYSLEEQNQIWQWILKHGKYVVTNCEDEEFASQNLSRKALKMENVQLALYRV